ncbi:MAG: hypothetical protein IIX86_05225, partial [Clostridia bacterium]|nr:hypothetical protein [Clostridia bacterium]
IEWVYDTNAATNFTTLHKKAGSCSKSNKFLLFSRYFRSLIGKLFLFYKIPIWVALLLLLHFIPKQHLVLVHIAEKAHHS